MDKEGKLFLVIVDDDWNTVVRAEGQIGAIQFVENAYILYGHTYDTMKALEIKPPQEV